jgi:hypothetical protein
MWYFGDVDAGGFRVALGAARRCAELHYPPLAPARPLYALALRHGTARPDPNSPGAADVARWAELWLGGDTGKNAAAVVASGNRIVQETVGTELLAQYVLADLLA